MEKEERGEQYKRSSTMPRAKILLVAIIPLAILAALVAFILGPGQYLINSGVPLPQLTIERIEFHEEGGKVIAVFVRNTGPMEISLAQADVNDRIHPAAVEPSKELTRLAEAKVTIPFPWNEGEPYEVGITTSDGTRFSKGVDAAAAAPTPSVEQASFFALIGTYVGVIPVLIGLLWFPLLRRIGRDKYNFFLALSAGLLVFLAIDALVEANEIAVADIAGVFNGQILIAMTTIIAFLALLYASEKLTGRAKKQTTTPQAGGTYQQAVKSAMTISVMIAIGIGLHNFGEGLAIGAAVLLGEVALGTFLIIGFAIHNTTEGLAIVAPLSGINRPKISRFVALGMIAGLPTIAGAWIGGFLYSPIATIVFLSVGAGAIFQVVFAIYSWTSGSTEKRPSVIRNTWVVAGFAVGMIIMYVTGLLIPS